ncbi:MAG TPA: VOC family protein [Longimicrobiales bacterium]
MNYGIAPAGFRLPADTHIGRVRLQIGDLGHSRDFYEHVLGFEVLAAGADTVTLGVGTRALIELVAGATEPLPQRHLGLYHFAILLPERAALGRCLRHLIETDIHTGSADHLVSEALYLSDPDGLGIEIYRDRERSEWSAHGRELVMTTEPLDSTALLASGGDEAWAGMPAGTIIGHVHLHVGDLERARAFYHNALGLDVVVWSYPGALFLSAGGYHHHLGVNTWAGPRAQAPAAGQPRLLDWELILPTGEAVAEASASLASASEIVSPEEVGGSIAVDPWGTSVHLRALVQ